LASILLYKYDAHTKNASTQSYPIHLAAERGFHKLLRTLLNHPDHPADQTVLSGFGETAIIKAVRGEAARQSEGRKTNEDAALKCVQLLVEKSCDLHARDNVGPKFTAVHLAATNGLWLLVDFFLTQNVNIDIAIGATTTRKLIEAFDSRWVVYYKGCGETGEDSREKLVHYMETLAKDMEEKEQYFADWVENNDADLLVNEPYKGRYTLLECAIKNRLSGVAKKLIEKHGADPNPALFVAIEEGEKFFTALTRSKAKLDLTKVVPGKSRQTILHRAVISKNVSLNVIKAILELAKEQIREFSCWVNARDYRGFTALHYAAKRHLNDVVRILLQYEANIFITDNFDVPTFFEMRPELIQSYLDSQIQMTEETVTEDKYGVVFNYSFLQIPTKPSKSIDKSTKDAYISVLGDERAGTEKAYLPELDPLKQLALSPRHRHLLTHPLIRSFLQLKWHRLYWFYWLNFIFYLAFTCFFTLYVFTTNFEQMSENTTTTESAKSEDPDGTTFSSQYNAIAIAGTSVFTVLLAVRELSQLLILGKKYLLRLENWLEIAIIVMTFSLLIVAPSNANPKVLSAILYLLVSLELVLLMGRHPRLATYVSMFFQVSKNFVKFLLWYMCLIFAFGISFYIIFNKCEGDDCAKNFFRDVPNSIFKTVVMISGEYEAGDINFEHVSITSHLIFIAFLFFISIVMINLLNGLAVSDTQEIKNEAELLFCISQAKYFSEIESTLLISCQRQNCCQFVKPCAEWMGKKIMLLNNLLPENKITVFLNRNNSMEPDVRFCGENDCLCCFSCVKLPFSVRNACNLYNEIVKDAVQIVNKENEDDKLDHILARIEHLEKLFDAKFS